MRFSPASLIVAGTCLVLGGSMALSQDARVNRDHPSPELASPELAMPELLPGYYNQTFTIQRMDISMPNPKMGTVMGSPPSLAREPRTERVCNTGDELTRASEFLPGGNGIGKECHLVFSRLEGTRGTGEFSCTTPDGQATVYYEGEFTETSRRAVISMQARPNKQFGQISFKLSVAMDRLTESCTDDIPADAASASAASVAEAAKAAM